MTRHIPKSLWAGLVLIVVASLVIIGLQTYQASARAAELAASRDIIARALGRPVWHFAYPYGAPTTAGPREFAIARELGFKSAVTTRPGMIFAEHREHLHALPRLSMSAQ